MCIYGSIELQTQEKNSFHVNLKIFRKGVYKKMPENITVYKFLFKAHIGSFNLKANISSPLLVSWKRSHQTSITEAVDMVSGKAAIQQTLSLPVNMYYDTAQQNFQQKKSVFTFTMKAPKGDKQAGVVYVDLAWQLNQKLEKLEKKFILEKCPVKNSEVDISITGECLGQKSTENMSQSSFMMQEQNPSTLSLQSHYKAQKAQPSSEGLNATHPTKQTIDNNSEQFPLNHPEVKQVLEEKNKKIKSLEQALIQLRQENSRLSSDLAREKSYSQAVQDQGGSGGLLQTLKDELAKAKSLQEKLQNQIESHRQEGQIHQQQLEQVRQKMEKVFQNMCRQFGLSDGDQL